MEDAADFKAAIPEPYQILGLKLLPISIGRYRLLRRFNVAFVSESETTAGIEDLIRGLVICSLRCDEFLRAYANGSLFKMVERWSRKIGAAPPWYLRGKFRFLSRTFIGRLWRRSHSFNFVEKMQLFKRYIAEAQHIPQYAPTSPNQSRSTGHWSTSVENVLRSELNWTAEEISEAPLTKALSDYFKHLELQGLVTIFTENDLEEGRANAEAMEQIAKALNLAPGSNCEQNPEFGEQVGSKPEQIVPLGGPNGA